MLKLRRVGKSCTNNTLCMDILYACFYSNRTCIRKITETLSFLYFRQNTTISATTAYSLLLLIFFYYLLGGGGVLYLFYFYIFEVHESLAYYTNTLNLKMLV